MIANEAETPSNRESPCVAGLWRRIGAASLDGLILGTIGMVLGTIFFSQLVEFGEWGRVIGLAIAIPYYAVLNSRIGRGQTVGKKLLGIRVVNARAENIGLRSATLRAVVLSLPWALNGTPYPSDNAIALQSLLSLGLFGVGGSIIYLAVANRHSRQSLHDLAAGSWVVRADSVSLPPKGLPRIHALVVVVLMVGSLSVPALVSNWIKADPRLEGIFPLQAAIQDAMETRSVSVYRGTSTFTSNSDTTTTQYLSVTVRFPYELEDFESIAREIASIVLEMDDRIETYDQLRIKLEYGFNILIARTSFHRSFSYTPAEWRAKNLEGI